MASSHIILIIYAFLLHPFMQEVFFMKQTLIIGAGVMGLSIARQLNSKHRHIRIIDRSTHE